MAITESQRKANNTARLQKVSPSIRRHVAAVIEELESEGYRPQIDAQVWRSKSQQAKLVSEGKSTVLYSYHNVSTSSGGADSLAVDLVDVRWQWNAPRSYWLRLAGAAERQGLTTGIYWGLTNSQRKAIRDAIAKKDWDAKVALGWDTAHIEPDNFSISRAKSGERPRLGTPKKPEPLRLFVRTDTRNTTRVKSAYIVSSKWYANEEEFARLLGEATYTPGAVSPVSSMLDRWGWVNVKYTLNQDQNRADLYVKKK